MPPGDNPEHGGEFTFNPRLHEPGAQKVLGKSYGDETVEQGRAVLRDLAANPATATHVATKLASHFVADTPPPALVERMVKAFLDTGGDLKQVAKVMVSSDEAWTQPPAKLKRPGEWAVGMVRDRDHAGRSHTVHGWAGSAWRAALASAVPQGVSGR